MADDKNPVERLDLLHPQVEVGFDKWVLQDADNGGSFYVEEHPQITFSSSCLKLLDGEEFPEVKYDLGLIARIEADSFVQPILKLLDCRRDFCGNELERSLSFRGLDVEVGVVVDQHLHMGFVPAWK